MSSTPAPITGPVHDVLDVVADVTCTPLAGMEPADLLAGTCRGLARLPGVDGVGAVEVDGDGQATVSWSTDPLTAALLDGQISQADGPLSVALTAAGPVVVDEQSLDSCGAEFAMRAGQVGVRAVAALPVAGEERLHAVIVLLRRQSVASTNTWPGPRLDVVTDMLGASLSNLDTLHNANELVLRLSDALAQQAPIEQAKGVLAQRHGVDLTEAFRMLRNYARRHRTPLRQAAKGVLGGSSVDDALLPQQRRRAGQDRGARELGKSAEKILRTR